jgi:hypothetical protein
MAVFLTSLKYPNIPDNGQAGAAFVSNSSLPKHNHDECSYEASANTLLGGFNIL